LDFESAPVRRKNMSPKKPLDFFERDMFQFLEIEGALFDQQRPRDRWALAGL
jgi:hypothetical protein